MDRRECLVRTAQGAALLMVGGCTVPPRVFRIRQHSRGDLRIRLADFPELMEFGGVVKVVAPRHRAIYVRRVAENRIVAVSGVCTHQGCIVGARSSGFRCPCHGSTYDVDGRNTGGPAPRPLTKFRAALKEDAVVLML